MLTLKTGVQVKIISESAKVVTVQAVESCGYNSNGDLMFETFNLSKKHHKGALLLNNISVL